MSNPCFELWVLLHFEGVSKDYKECGDVKKRLKEILGGYSGTNSCQFIPITDEMVLQAMARARSLDTDQQPLLTKTATRVYQILDLLIQKDAIRFSSGAKE